MPPEPTEEPSPEVKRRTKEHGRETPEHQRAEQAAERGDRYDAEAARVRVAGGDAIVLDIRPEEEWLESRIPGAKHVAEEEVDSAIEDLPDDKQVIVVCADGSRSAEIAKRLNEAGRDASAIEGGMRAWDQASLLTQPSEDPETPV
jgi:rhodanese-related sulfurtransferase